MKTIGRYIILAAIAVGVVSCGAGNNKTNGQAKTDAVQNVKTEKIKHLTEKEFLAKVVDYKNNSKGWKYLGDKPAIVDFYASWCGPCKALAPVLEELATEYEGQIYIYKIDTEQEEALASAFGIQSIPTLIFIPMNEDPQIVQGAIPKQDLKNMIDKFLLKTK